MKTKLCLVILFFNLSSFTAQSQAWVWARSAGGTSYDLANDIYTDANGNSYITGWYQNTVNFGPDTLTSVGGYDFYLAKYDAAGTCLWAQGTGSAMNDIGYGVVADALGNIYVTGTYWNTVVFGSTALTASGGSDIFVAKYNSSGVCQWAATGGAPVFNEQGQAIALDASGDVIINGYFMGTATFGTTTFASYGSSDVFTAKINSSGAWQWAVQGGSPNGDNGYGVSCDANNNIYITGYFRSTATFGSQTITTSGMEDIYIVKYNSAGVCQWAQKAGGVDDDHGNGIVSDAGGNVYLTGWFTSGTMSFGTINITAANSNEEAFVAKYNTSGVPQWAVDVGSAGYEIGTGICLDISGNPVISGTYSATFTIGTTTLNANAGGDFFVARFSNANGNNMWALNAAGPDNDVAYKVSSDGLGNIYCAGGFYTTCFFGTISITSLGIADIFLAKIDPTLTGIFAEENNSEVILFPNPVLNQLSVISYQLSEIREIEFYNVPGEKVLSQRLTTNNKQTTINVSELKSGVYFISITDSKGNRAVKKFVKM